MEKILRSERTVTPQRHALAISGLTATTVTATLRKKREMMRKNWETNKTIFRNRMNLPVQHHTCSHPVCGHYEDTGTERQRASPVRHHHQFLLHFYLQSFVYLAGVSCAGLRNVTFVNSIAARHTSQLILSKTTRENREANH